MRILQVGTGFSQIPSTGTYATERVIHYLSTAISELKHEVTVLDIKIPNRQVCPYEIEEVEIHQERRDVNFATHTLRGLMFASAIGTKLKNMVNKGKFDIVHFNNQFSARNINLVHGQNVASFYTLHNGIWNDSDMCRSMFQRLRYFQDIRAMRTTSKLVCLNNAIESNVNAYFGIPENRTVVISNGISPHWFENQQLNEKLIENYAKLGNKIILSVARIAPWKNQLTIARAIPLVAKEVAGVHFLFVGPVADMKYYKKICNFLEESNSMSKVSFIGEIPYADLPTLYSISSIVVCPSIFEASPLVPLEAMARGTPVIASDIVPFYELSKYDIGRNVPVLEYEALARTIVELIDDESLRIVTGMKAREYVRTHYTWEIIARKMIRAYESVVHGIKFQPETVDSDHGAIDN
jgi:glycosyltransferase involved in cell wall biosynthesis